MDDNQQQCTVTDVNEQKLVLVITMERLEKYLHTCNGNISNALKLYKKNALEAALLYPLLQGIEVTLRNTIHREMTKKWGENWFKKAPLGYKEQEMIEKSLRNLPPNFTTGHVIADLSFGFWLRLMSTHYYQKLWVPVLYRCFKVRKHQKEIHAHLLAILTLRNRIAHYEPIFMRDTAKDRAMILEAIGWLEPEMAKWLSN